MRRLSLLVVFLLLAAWAIPSLHGQDSDGNGVADRFDLRGTQPNRLLPAYDTKFNIDTEVLSVTECDRCHKRDNRGPFRPWAGSMMGNSARDPVFWAQLDLAEGDEKLDPTHMAGARDLCLRCHVAKGWLEGRSSGDANAFRGMKMHEGDLFGVQCEVCHRMVDPSLTRADSVDRIMLDGLKTNPDPELQIPLSFGNGMYVMDRTDVRRGPYSIDQIGWPFLKILFVRNASDWPPFLRHVKNHFSKESLFHRSGNICGTCHDVSNPAWTPQVPKGDAQHNFPIERTWTEWKYSRYSTMGEAGNCQSCHMSGPFNDVIDGGTSVVAHDPAIHLNDVHVHDFTGGNVWIPRIAAEMITRFNDTKSADPGPHPQIGDTRSERDEFLNTHYASVIKALYPEGTFAPAGGKDLSHWSWYDQTANEEASRRAIATLKRSADLSGSRSPGEDLKVRVWNKTGHKLPTGYPEGRRMWLQVRFLDIDPATGHEKLIAESGEYDDEEGLLYHDFNLDDKAGPRSYDVATYTDGKGGTLPIGRRTQVYESRAHHLPSHKEFHFILNNEVVSDNRIPPEGWNKKAYRDNNAAQVINAAYKDSQMEYHDSTTGPASGLREERYNFDEVSYPVPGSSDIAEVTLWYQSVSREYIEELVAASPRTVVYPEGSGKEGFTRADILEHAWRTFDYEGKQRIPPVEMTRLRIALVDTDGDGLPDDWEKANGLDPGNVSADAGRRGDYDGDGRSNYLEFQAKSSTHSAERLRKPLDLVLVLDFSGSMNDPASSGSHTTVEALKNAVDLFLKTYKQFAVKHDRIGIVYFSNQVEMEGGGLVDLSTLPAGTTLEEKIDGLIAAVRNRPAAGLSSMGGGLQTALRILGADGAEHGKHIVLFSNGMQNSNPMVQKDASGNYFIANAPVSPGRGIQSDSGVTDAQGPAFGTPLPTLGIPIHAINMSGSVITDNIFTNFLNGLSDSTRGRYLFSPRESDLEGAFLHDLIESLRGSSPVMVAENADQLDPFEETKTFEFQMDAATTKAVFILSWAGTRIPGRLAFDLITPEGKPAQGVGRLTEGPNYLIGTYSFPLVRENGPPLVYHGPWKMVVRRQSPDPSSGASSLRADAWPDRIDFRNYLLADVAQMEFLFLFSKTHFNAGEDVELEAVVLDRFEPIRTQSRVKATITRLSKGVGTFLSQTHVDPDKIKEGMNVHGDPLPDPAASKARLALMDQELVQSSISLIREEIELYDDGNPEHGDHSPNDGLFSARLDMAHVPGLLYADVDITGKSARTHDFTRRLRVVSLVEHGKFSPQKSIITGAKLGSEERGGWTVQVKAIPIDELGNYLGPGFSSQVSIEAPDHQTDSSVQDLLDGGYMREFKLSRSELGRRIKITAKGDLIFNGPIASIVEGPLAAGAE